MRVTVVVLTDDLSNSREPEVFGFQSTDDKVLNSRTIVEWVKSVVGEEEYDFSLVRTWTDLLEGLESNDGMGTLSITVREINV